MIKSIYKQVYADIKNVQHDIFLLYLIPIPLLLSLVFKFLYIQIEGFVGSTIDISPYYNISASYIFLLLPPMLWGTVFAFLIINEKDLHTIDAIRVTPSGLRRLVYYRIFSGIVLSAITQLTSFILLNFILTSELFYLILLASFMSPFMMFSISILAKNKVQAFALMKVLSTFFVIPFFYLLVPRIEIVFYFVPSYWIFKPLISNFTGSSYSTFFATMGVVIQILWLFILHNIFKRSLQY